MKKFHTITVDGEEYKLRLTASSISTIEKKLNKSLNAALKNTQDNTLETIITILWGARQPFDSSFTFENAQSLFDQYIDDGNSIEELMQEINGLFETSGFFKKGQAE